jgi:hypothetical protein
MFPLCSIRQSYAGASAQARVILRRGPTPLQFGDSRRPLDFMGDAANYGISLYAVAQAVHWRSPAPLAKATGMGLIGTPWWPRERGRSTLCGRGSGRATPG